MNLFQRNFVTEMKRADEMERRIRFLEAQLANFTGEEEADISRFRYEEVTHEPSNTGQMEELEVEEKK